MPVILPTVSTTASRHSCKCSPRYVLELQNHLLLFPIHCSRQWETVVVRVALHKSFLFELSYVFRAVLFPPGTVVASPAGVESLHPVSTGLVFAAFWIALLVAIESDGCNPPADRDRRLCAATDFRGACLTSGLAAILCSCASAPNTFGMVEEKQTAANTIIPNSTSRLRFTIKRAFSPVCDLRASIVLRAHSTSPGARLARLALRCGFRIYSGAGGGLLLELPHSVSRRRSRK
jgi:hypothetical protein